MNNTKELTALTGTTAGTADIEGTSVTAGSSGDIEFSDRSRLPREPLVSVDLITYQHAAFIKESLDSVLMQKVNFPYEICIGEDGSIDGTREICLEYAKKHPDKIRLFLRDRSLPIRKVYRSPARHNGSSTFNSCCGKYIALLEGDDFWTHPKKLQNQVDMLEGHSNLAGCCHYAACMPDKQPWKTSITPGTPVVERFSVEKLLNRDIGNLHTSTWLLRRREAMRWQGFNSSLFGDIPLIAWALLRGPAIVMPQVWSVYRTHEGGVFSPLSTEVKLRENVELWKCLGSIVPKEMESAVSIGLSRTVTMYIRSLIKAGQYRTAYMQLMTNLSDITKIDCTMKMRNHLRFLAFEAMIIPQFAALRKRCSQIQRKNLYI